MMGPESTLKAAESLLRVVNSALRKHDVRQAAEKLWGASAPTVKAYAYWSEGGRLTSHGELGSGKRKPENKLGEWVHDSWASAAEMHICFYESLCDEKNVIAAKRGIKRLMREITLPIKEKH